MLNPDVLDILERRTFKYLPEKSSEMRGADMAAFRQRVDSNGFRVVLADIPHRRCQARSQLTEIAVTLPFAARQSQEHDGCCALQASRDCAVVLFLSCHFFA